VWRDLTHLADFRVDGDASSPSTASDFINRLKKRHGFVERFPPAGRTIKLPVTVANFEKPHPVSFRNDVIAALNVGGCNSGACHGTPTGKETVSSSSLAAATIRRLISSSLREMSLGRRTDSKIPI